MSVTASPSSPSAATSGKPLLERIVQRIFHSELVVAHPELGDCYFRAFIKAILEERISVTTPTLVTILTLKVFQRRPSLEETIRNALQRIDSTDVQKGDFFKVPDSIEKILTDLPRRLEASLAPAIISQLTLRMEPLIDENVRFESFLVECYEQWLRMVTLPPSGDTGSVLRNLTFLTIRATQRDGEIGMWVRPWEALLHYDGHVECVIKTLVYLVVVLYRKRKLVDILTLLILQLCRGSASRKNHILQTIEKLINPATILIADPQLAFISNEEEPDIDICTRLETCLQSVGGGSLPLSFTTGHLLTVWIQSLVADGLIDLSSSGPSRLLLEIFASLPEYSNSLNISIAIPKREGIEDFLLTLQWAVSCPVKKICHFCFSKLYELMNSQSGLEYGHNEIVLVFWSFLRKLGTVSREDASLRTPTSISIGMLAGQVIRLLALANQNNQSCQCLTKAHILPSLLGCHDAQIFLATLELADLVLQVGDLEALITLQLVRGFSHETTFAHVINFFWGLAEKVNKDNIITAMNAGYLLVALLPSFLHKSFFEEIAAEMVPILVLTLEDLPGLEVAQRTLQTMGKRMKTPLELAHDLARIYCDEALLPLSGLVLRTLILASHNATHWLDLTRLLLFLETWLTLLSPPIVEGNDNDVIESMEILDELLSCLLKITADLQLLGPLIKVIKARCGIIKFTKAEKAEPLVSEVGFLTKLSPLSRKEDNNSSIEAEVQPPIIKRREVGLQPS